MNKIKEFINSGHTLIELLVVMGIVSILAVVAIPLFQSYQEDSRIDELKATLLKAAAAQENYFAATGQYAALPETLANHGYPTLPNDKMKLFTGIHFTSRTGMTYWVAGNYDVNPDVTNTYNECWIYVGAVMGTGDSDNFMRLHKETGNESKDVSVCPYCPTLDEVCK